MRRRIEPRLTAAMPDESAVANAQAALTEVARQLLAVQERLQAINRRLPVPLDQAAMLEGKIAPDLATELSCSIAYVTEDPLPRAIETLQHAAVVTPDDLMRSFRNNG